MVNCEGSHSCARAQTYSAPMLKAENARCIKAASRGWALAQCWAGTVLEVLSGAALCLDICMCMLKNMGKRLWGFPSAF